MSIEAPHEARWNVEEGPDGLTFRMPARSGIQTFLFVPVWLVVWGFGEAAVWRVLVYGPHTAPVRGLVEWLVAWTIGGALVLLVFL